MNIVHLYITGKEALDKIVVVMVFLIIMMGTTRLKLVTMLMNWKWVMGGRLYTHSFQYSYVGITTVRTDRLVLILTTTEKPSGSTLHIGQPIIKFNFVELVVRSGR